MHQRPRQPLPVWSQLPPASRQRVVTLLSQMVERWLAAHPRPEENRNGSATGG